MKSYLEYVKMDKTFDIELLEYQAKEWNKIGKSMLNMGCARNAEAVV